MPVSIVVSRSAAAMFFNSFFVEARRCALRSPRGWVTATSEKRMGERTKELRPKASKRQVEKLLYVDRDYGARGPQFDAC